jgi:DNA-binding FadR family transcriptional regulator
MSRHQKVDYIREELVAGILRGEYGADRPVPREVDLAEAFEVSRHTIRSATIHLAAHDVVEVTHGRAGAAVRPPGDWNLLDPSLLEAVLDSSLSREVLAEALECRRVVTPAAAALAAERATAGERAMLDRLLDEVLEADDAPRLGTRPVPELELHRAVVAASHNRFLARVATSLESALAGGAGRPYGDVAQQQAILAALHAGDAQAARDAMRAWLDSVKLRSATRRRRSTR